MTEEIINTCEYYKICESACGGTLEDTELCSCYQLYKQLKRLEFELKVTKADYEASEQENKQMKSALEEILESAKFAQCLPCGSENLEDCLNCADEITNNGQFCMEKRIHEIKTKCVEVLGENN